MMTACGHALRRPVRSEVLAGVHFVQTHAGSMLAAAKSVLMKPHSHQRDTRAPAYCVEAPPAVIALIVIATVACFAYAAWAMYMFSADVGTPRLAAGASHVCRLASEGHVRCRGDNTNGQLGDGTTTSRLIDVEVVGLQPGALALVAGRDHTCAWHRDGSMQCWGGRFGISPLAAASPAR